MFVHFTCPNCKTPMEIDSASCGSIIECPTCKAPVTVPEKKITPGVTVGGFKIEKLLGEGGMGQVWLARQLSMDRQVAIKILPATLEHGNELKDRFLNEVRISARLQHPNIVAAYEAGEDAGVLFLAMEYVKGVTLDERLRRDKTLPEKEALEIARKIAAALDYAWTEHKILHRDIKPANVMLAKNSDPKVMDMGLSKRLDAREGLTISGDIMGTPNYMSPEQAEGKSDLDPRSDMYSLGLTLYHMVTGSMPYAGSSLMETLRKQANESLPDPREVNPALTDACTELLVMITAHDRSLRPPSWPELLKNIDTASAGAWTAKPLVAGTSTILHMHRDKGGGKGVKPRLHVPARAPSPPPAEPARLRKSAWLIPAVAAGIVVVIAGAWFALRPKADKAAPAVAASPSTSGQLAGLSNRFAATLQHARAQSNSFNDAIAAFESICQDGAGTDYAARARAEIDKLQAAALARVMEAMQAQAKALSNDGKPDEAAAMLMAYAGPLADETAKAREALAAGIRRKADEQKQAADEKKMQAEAKQSRMAKARLELNELIGQTVADLVKEDAAGARRRLTVATANPDLEPVADAIAFLSAQARAASEMDKRIAASFAAEKGKEISVELKNMKATVTIVEIDGTDIKARQLVNGVQAEVKFSIAKLSVAEKCRRVQGDEAELALLRGLAAMEGGKAEQAEAEFGKITETARAEIKPAAAVYVTALVEAVHKAQAGQQEAEAQKTLESILAQIGIPGPYADAGNVAERISTNIYNVRQVNPIHQAIADWNGKYAQTGYGKAMLPVTEGLAAVQADKAAFPSTTAGAPAAGGAAKSAATFLTPTAQVARKKLDALLKLARADPAITGDDVLAASIGKQSYAKNELARLLAAYEEFDKQFGEAPIAQDYEQTLYALWLASQPPVELKEASNANLEAAMAELKLKSNISAAGRIEGGTIRLQGGYTAQDKRGSLKPLAGLPVSVLEMHGYANELKYLRGMPLEKLNIGILEQGDLAIISSLPIKSLRINGAGIRSLKPLARLSQMTTLCIGSESTISRISDIAPLKNLPLQQLALYNFAALEDLSAISEMRDLHSLIFSGGNDTPGKLKSLPDMRRLTKLEKVEIWNTRITSLLPLTDCITLRDLKITGCPVAELTPLPPTLTTLDISDCEKITNLEKLPDFCPNLRKLSIDEKSLAARGTDMRNLKSLARLSQVTALFIGSENAISRISDITALKDLPLQQLVLFNFVALDDLSAISEMRDLKSLQFSSGKDSPGKLKSLPDMRKLTKLETVDLKGTRITSLLPLADCPALINLRLVECPVTELKPLSMLSDTLSFLDIRGCEKISDLEQLPDFCPNLRKLVVYDKQIRAAWIGKLPETLVLEVSSRQSWDRVYYGPPTAEALARLDPEGAKKPGGPASTTKKKVGGARPANKK